MKTIAAFACALLFSTAAKSELVTYEYTTTITSLTHYLRDTGEIAIQQISLPVGNIAVGDVVKGRFTFDTDWGALDYYPYGTPEWAMYGGDGGHVSATFAQGLNFSTSRAGVDVFNNTSSNMIDEFDMSGGEDLGVPFGDPSHIVSISFVDPSAQVLDSVEISEASPLLNAAYGSFSYIYTTQFLVDRIRAQGALTDLRLVSNVPEPRTYLMLAAGLALLAWRRKQG